MKRWIFRLGPAMVTLLSARSPYRSCWSACIALQRRPPRPPLSLSRGDSGAVAVLDFTTETARVHAGLFATLSQQGQMIGAHDLIIAATTLLHDSVVLTTNAAEFARVPSLDVLTPPVS